MKKKIKLLISAGPTVESLDPVRFLSNHSTGIMGYTIAVEAKKRGYEVTLVSGKTHLKKPTGIKVLYVETAMEMQKALLNEFKNHDCLIMNAAVCDYRPHKFSLNKIKKHKGTLHLKLVRNPDILKTLSRYKKNKLLIGFALETEDVIKNAFEKLKNKKLDLIVAMTVSKENLPFGQNRVTSYILDNKGDFQELSDITKQNLSRKLLDRVEGLWYTKRQK